MPIGSLSPVPVITGAVGHPGVFASLSLWELELADRDAIAEGHDVVFALVPWIADGDTEVPGIFARITSNVEVDSDYEDLGPGFTADFQFGVMFSYENGLATAVRRRKDSLTPRGARWVHELVYAVENHPDRVDYGLVFRDLDAATTVEQLIRTAWAFKSPPRSARMSAWRALTSSDPGARAEFLTSRLAVPKPLLAESDAAGQRRQARMEMFARNAATPAEAEALRAAAATPLPLAPERPPRPETPAAVSESTWFDKPSPSRAVASPDLTSSHGASEMTDLVDQASYAAAGIGLGSIPLAEKASENDRDVYLVVLGGAILGAERRLGVLWSLALIPQRLQDLIDKAVKMGVPRNDAESTAKDLVDDHLLVRLPQSAAEMEAWAKEYRLVPQGLALGKDPTSTHPGGCGIAAGARKDADRYEHAYLVDVGSYEVWGCSAAAPSLAAALDAVTSATDLPRDWLIERMVGVVPMFLANSLAYLDVVADTE